uniref:Nucleolar protein 4 like n=1 Tax=Callorhinchus milii TaxID=7868 RepID=A0A4W3JLD3_CALMI
LQNQSCLVFLLAVAPSSLNGPSHASHDSSSECCSGNGSSALNPPAIGGSQGKNVSPDMNGNSSTGLDYSGSSEDQPVNLSERLQPGHVTPAFQADNGSTDGQRNRVKYTGKTAPDVRLDREGRDYGCKSPPYSSGSYDSGRNEGLGGCPEDLSISRGGDDDDDEHDHDEDNEKINDSEGMDPERLKAFNMFVRLFVDENLDRMVPISKQPKEKIQAIIESCSRQFPEFQERARKRIRTYLKSCRRLKKNGIELTRPTPSHLTSAMAENILAAACESESRKAAKRMRLESYQQQDEPIALDKHSLQARESTQFAHTTTYSLPAASFSQDQMYINGGLNYSYRGYGGIGGGLQHPSPLQTGNLSNGPTDLSMKALASNSASSNTNNSRSVATTQLSPTEITAVRQLIAGYRESAAFLLRSADELENLILQQN